MYKPTQALCRARLRLTTKQVNGGYYKGNRTGSLGSHTMYGGYIIDYRKVRTYVVPEGLEYFKLTPFVTRQMEPTKPPPQAEDEPLSEEPNLNAMRYLDHWRELNPEEYQRMNDEAHAQRLQQKQEERARARQEKREQMRMEQEIKDKAKRKRERSLQRRAQRSREIQKET